MLNAARALRARLGRPAPARLATRHEGVLGTRLDVHVVASTAEAARLAESDVLDEFDRLERAFSRYRADSELNRWQATRHEDAPVGAELARLLRVALEWHERTGGAFHPGADALAAAWRDAERSGREPAPHALNAILEDLRAPLWSVDEARGTARRLTPLTANLNAIAKGRVVDRAAERAAARPGVRGIVVNAGGDLRAIGPHAVEVSVEDPFRPYDNAAPLALARVRDAAVATSGGAHRGFVVGGRHRSHLLDPRTGRPAERVASATVIAATCETADALATAAAILEPHETLALIDATPGAACLIVTVDGGVHANRAWTRVAGPVPARLAARKVNP